MIEQLPLSQRPIFVTWHSAEGGLAITARTDQTGQAFIGHHVLDRYGMPTGRPCEYVRSSMMINMVAGYVHGKATIIFADIEINARGLSLRVNLPSTMSPTPRYMSAKWGSRLPPCWMDLRPFQDWLADIHAIYLDQNT